MNWFSGVLLITFIPVTQEAPREERRKPICETVPARYTTHPPPGCAPPRPEGAPRVPWGAPACPAADSIPGVGVGLCGGDTPWAWGALPGGCSQKALFPGGNGAENYIALPPVKNKPRKRRARSPRSCVSARGRRPGTPDPSPADPHSGEKSACPEMLVGAWGRPAEPSRTPSHVPLQAGEIGLPHVGVAGAELAERRR